MTQTPIVYSCITHGWRTNDGLYTKQIIVDFCLVCFRVFSATPKFSCIETLPLPVKGRKFWLTLMAIEPWGFFSVPHQLWHGASICNSHFRGLETLAHFAESLAVELSLPVFMTSACRRWDSNTKPSASEANAPTDCATTAVKSLLKVKLLSFSHFRN